MSIETLATSETNPDAPAILQRIHSFIPAPDARPKRCRAVIFNPSGTGVLGIQRNRPGRNPYVVYPGGGVEESDQTALDCIWRELHEELELTPNDVVLTGKVVQIADEFFYLGYARQPLQQLAIHGPEAARDPNEAGTYTPEWVELGTLLSQAFPVEMGQAINHAAFNN